MNDNTQINRDDLRLSLTSRIIRIILGFMLFTIPFFQGEITGAITLLPLLAIYPFLTGILGFGLVEVMAVSNQCRSENPPRQVKFGCTCLFTLGTGVIVFVMLNEILPAWVALAPIFLLLMAILGFNQFGKVLFGRRISGTANNGNNTIKLE